MKRISRVSIFALLVIFSSLISAATAQDTSGSNAESDAPSVQQTVTVDQIHQYGLVAIAEGELKKAIALFRTVLSVAPGHLAARRALVGILIKTGNYSAAEFHLHELLRTDPNPHSQFDYQKSLEEIVKVEPLKFSGTFAVLPSTNVNNGTQNIYFDTDLGQFVIDESGRETSGVGLNLGVGANYRWALGLGQTLKMASSLSGVWYEIEALRHIDATVALSYQRETAKTLWSIGPYIRRSWYAPNSSRDTSDNTTRGIALSYARQISPSDKISIGASLEDQLHLEKPYLSGPFLSGTLKLEHRLNPKTQYFITFGAQRYKPEAAHMAYQGLNVTAGMTTILRNSLVTGVTVGIGHRGYDANFTSLLFPREDDYYSVELSALNNNFELFGIVPRFSCTYKRNLSNVAFYDYQTTDCKISMVQNF